MSNRKFSHPWLFMMGIGFTTVALTMDFPNPWPQLLAFLLLMIWPALTWFSKLDGLWNERALTAAALAPLLSSLVALALAYIPGPIRPFLHLFVYTFMALLPLVIRRDFPDNEECAFDFKLNLSLMGVFFLAVFLRIPNLGYSEFQGDEGVIMGRAAAVIQGDFAELFLHQKGPMEILIPMSLWGLAGSINEYWARLPFSWCSILAGIAVFCLARRWFSRYIGNIGGFAGLMFAISGFSVAFGRIVQYQSLVMLWGVLAMLFATRYVHDSRREDLIFSAVFLAGGLLAHYDASLVVPVIGWLLLNQAKQNQRIKWLDLSLAAIIGTIILSFFFPQYIMSPSIARTGKYLLLDRLGVRGDHGILSWSGPAVWQMITFYNSIYFITGLIGLAGLGLWILVRERKGFAAVLSFITPLLFYLFIVRDPRTHAYTILPGAIILASVGLGEIFRNLNKAQLRYFAAGAFAAFALVSANYTYLMFIDNIPERQRTWEENQPPGYPTTWKSPPLYGLFGFPHQAGWRVVHDLLPDSGFPYATNEEKEVTTWYMEQKPHTHCANFNTFILAENAQDEIPFGSTWLEAMNLQYRVTVNGRPSLQIFSRQSIDEVKTYESTSVSQWLTPAQISPPYPEGSYPVDAILGDDQVKLLGFNLDDTAAFPDGQIVITLYWQALVSFDRNYQVFVHLYNGELRAQHDGTPECGINPTTRWEPGQIITDPHIIKLPGDMALRSAAIYVGMYDLLTLERLGINGRTIDSIHLIDILIEPHR